MKIRALVAKADGVPDSQHVAFAPHSIEPSTDVPVTQDFDRRVSPIGTADIEVAPNGDVYAVIDTDAAVCGRYPALGGIAVNSDATITAFHILEVSICTSGNADQRIPAIHKP